MGAKTWMLVYADADADPRELFAANPVLDRESSARLAVELFPKDRIVPLDDGDLCDTCPANDELRVGCFPGVAVIAAREFGIDRPSRLSPRFLQAAGARTVYLHAMHSVVDWFAFAIWRAGRLERSLSLSPDGGILEDIGRRLPFERPYWAGQHSAFEPTGENDAYPFPFHPLDLGEAALETFFGYRLEGEVDPDLTQPESVPLMRFKRRKVWFKLW